MKVMVVSYLLDPRIGGGGATAALRLCQGLVAEGVDVVGVTTQSEKETRVSDELGFKTYAFRPRNLYWVANKDKHSLGKKVIWQAIDTWNVHVYQMMRSLIRAEKPDVVHVHKLRGLSPSVWSAAAVENRHPIVQSCHDYELISPEGSLESTVGRLALRQSWPLRPYQKLRARWSLAVDTVTAPSEYTLSTITGLDYFRTSQQLVIPNSHGFSQNELDHLALNGNSPDSDDLHLLYLGRLELIKGIDVLCSAFAAVARDFPTARLDVAGRGSQEEYLRTMYASVPQICFHGHVTGEQKANLIARADALVMPSIVREVFGISIVEAYAHGKPVIASRMGGIPEVVQDGTTGILVNPNDVTCLQQVIRQFASEPGKARAMTAACRQAAKDYTIESVTNAYLEAYELNRLQSRRTPGPKAHRNEPIND